MSAVTVRELRNQGAAVIDRVLRGEHLTVTRDGVAVAELIPLRRRPLSAAVVLARSRGLPAVDPKSLRADIDAVINPSL